MKDKDLPPDNNMQSLEELTDQANKILELLEKEKDLSNSVESYQELLKLNKIIEKKFHKNLKNISEDTKNKVKAIIEKKNETYT
jgi:predicted small metal-binding protein